MSNKLRFTTEALNDYKDTILWYAEIESQLADEFEKEVETALNTILKEPQLFQKIERNTRRIILRRFPYGVFYIEQDSSVIITAIMHHRREPRF